LKQDTIFDFLINLKKSVSADVNKTSTLTKECTEKLYQSYVNTFGDKANHEPIEHDKFFDFGRVDYSNLRNSEYFKALSSYIAEVEALEFAIIMKDEFIAVLRKNKDLVLPILEYMDKKYDFGFMSWFNKSKYLFAIYYKDMFDELHDTIDYNVYYSYSADNVMIVKPRPYGPDDSSSFVRSNILSSLSEYMNYYNDSNTIALDKVLLHFAGVINKDVETV
jgi:hypothetical protein